MIKREVQYKGIPSNKFMSKKIGIIGGGFSGTLTAFHIVNKATAPCKIFIINEKDNINKGIAYNPYSEKHILNVIAGKMSAFPDKHDHFLDWVMKKKEFKNMDRTLVSNSFLPRMLYGEYLCNIWQITLEEAGKKNITIVEINDTVKGLNKNETTITLLFNISQSFDIDLCVIATGNQVPKNPQIHNTDFYKSSNYFQNPWKENSVKDIKGDLPILIVGNGLTMVDTIIGLLEQNFKGKIYSISPNGFNILPHRHSGVKYTAHLEEIDENISLINFVQIVNKHIKILREFGVSAEPIIDSLRPITQKIWRNLSILEKKVFMARLRHLFGVARHRIPLHIYDKIQKLRLDGTLHIQSGKIIDIIEEGNIVEVTYYDKKQNSSKKLKVSRVINCTGPESDFSKIENSFLSQCIEEGILTQDELKLGIKTNIETFKVYTKDNEEHFNIYTLGSNLKGELWESTAVSELRQQAESLANGIVNEMNSTAKGVSHQF